MGKKIKYLRKYKIRNPCLRELKMRSIFEFFSHWTSAFPHVKKRMTELIGHSGHAYKASSNVK
jgi:hypothetical protein